MRIWTTLLFLFGNFVANAQQFSVSNSLAFNATDELIVLKRFEIEKAFPNVLTFKKISVQKSDGSFIVLQLDDLDQDGIWDEAVFLTDLEANSKTTFKLVDLKANAVHFYPRAHVRLRKKTSESAYGKSLSSEIMPLQNPPTDFQKTPLPLYLTEGPAWENDKVAFRSYFDTRNGKDIFGKLTRKMMTDTVGTKSSDNYHKISDWGMDILHAGNSLGAGSLAFGISINGKDSIVRLGGNDVSGQTFTRIADGAYRAIFKLDYDWTFFGKPVKISEEISIWGGQYFYESRVTITGAPSGTVMYAGIANFYNNVFDHFSVDEKSMSYSAGNQSELRDKLMLAIAVDEKKSVPVIVAPKEHDLPPGYKQKIFDSYLVGQKITDGKAGFRFYSFWERSLSADKKTLEAEAEKYANPPIITWLDQK
ncbi:MAG: DUF4861 domain-containing protein [Flavobacterium sp.]|uniref:DUF4861 family protein n=1 Tax=Flavobacterium sp. TaxID=239 RepID=UPI0012145718|nr:DUF4861 family protein [Flavobacterium sp.]RZJ63370.1 MAG: DUF4861 domain-containing protein [Flavobacterium sp.]